MRIRPALVAPAAAALTVLLLATGATAAVPAPDEVFAPAALATCRESVVEVTATASGAVNQVRISVTNKSGRACVVDRIPTITFGDLDGAAQPVPPVESAPYRLAAGGTAYAAVRTIDPAAEDSRTVAYLTVAGDPSHYGARFDAASLGSPAGIPVWEPVTTLWQPTRAKADAALAAARR
ncbi:DUF4232 domain-containing protein [Streptomyces scopuliridis]|uniref:DUF4232 domain-containing protein n=1 Tax=Streptomyces scopuliridis TaxID=452529 RepID=A0ACD4ZD75_9ACTN|nr:DUF4232 domain-containing protein [Streptomyces scopuliridis]WSB32038.1 DUF4232 domain-containing protein [Streptomyces scopuliridis]WSB96299.1 DUF4232 domain-containing protein [Streptomyces scopuliridis]WSC09996.1 DUF4232 domain-containing protein [Streptomyces scopuliridis]